MSNQIPDPSFAPDHFGENKRIYDETLTRLAKAANDRTAEYYHAKLLEMKPEVEHMEEWMKNHGYTV